MILESDFRHEPHPASEDADAPRFREFERHPILDKSELGADYNGDWTILLHTRFTDSVIKERYLGFKRKFPTTEMRSRSYFQDASQKFILEKPTDVPNDEYEEMISPEAYDTNLKSIFASTETRDSINYNLQPYNQGVSAGWRHPGVVFRDATDQYAEPLGIRQKNIVEAHEKAHGILMGMTNGEMEYIRSVFNTVNNRNKGKIIKSYSNKEQIGDVVARMTQLKNYFGFKGGEEFTRDHLDFARENYIKDTGLDNNMSEFFDAIDRENEDRFIELMNTVAC